MIVEPVVGNMGCVPPAPGFLEALRELTTRHGALLIFDEVMTGFRVALGGAQQRFGITPDLTTLGKIIGGGLPIAAYGGRADIMRKVAPLGPVYQAGTLSGNPLSVAAGLAMLRYLVAHPELYEQLEARAAAAHGVDSTRRHHQSRGRDVHIVLFARSGDGLGLGQEVRHRTLRPVLPLHAGARRVPGALAVRSGVSVDGPQRGRHPLHRGRRARVFWRLVRDPIPLALPRCNREDSRPTLGWPRSRDSPNCPRSRTSRRLRSPRRSAPSRWMRWAPARISNGRVSDAGEVAGREVGDQVAEAIDLEDGRRAMSAEPRRAGWAIPARM